MARHYCCYIFRKDGNAVAWRAFECESDTEAHDHARGLLVGYPHADGVEVWESSGSTLYDDRSNLRTPAELRRLCRLASTAAHKEIDREARRVIASLAFALAQKAEVLERRKNAAEQ